MGKNSIVSIIVLIVILGGGYYFYSSSTPKQVESPIQEQKPIVTTTNEDTNVTTTTEGLTVLYTDSGFTPSKINIKQGTKVTFVNRTSSKMWVASDPHPTHEGYSGTIKNEHCPDTKGIAFDQCSSSDNYTFTFGKIGTWGYHNHSASQNKGTIVVTQ